MYPVTGFVWLKMTQRGSLWIKQLRRFLSVHLTAIMKKDLATFAVMGQLVAGCVMVSWHLKNREKDSAMLLAVLLLLVWSASRREIKNVVSR